MLDPIRAILADLSRQYQDNRVQHCQIEVASLESGRCLLAGTVLDKSTLGTVTKELASHFPRLTFDTSGVQILRQPTSSYLVVVTNVTGLHAEPSFRSEMMDQLLIGTVVELLISQSNWLYVRMPDGYLGWVYKNYLEPAVSTSPTHYVCEPITLLRQEPKDDAAVAGRLLAGTAVTVTETSVTNGVREFQPLSLAGNTNGWLLKSHLRAQEMLPDAPEEQRAQMMKDAVCFVGVPYLWGGFTTFGIDCSGYVRLLHRLSGILIPRDADMQFLAGKPVEPPFQPGDLLFFGSSSGHRNISHVGMSLGGWEIIHASRPNNGVYQDDVEKTGWLNDIFVGARTFVL